MISKKVLVAGASGYLGQHFVKELKQRGYWVRVLIRNKKQKNLFRDVDDYFIGQITDPKTLKGLTVNIDWIFSTIGITRQKDGLSYMDVDYQGNANLLAEAKKSEVSAFQYISAINGNNLRHLKIFEAKEKFVDELKTSDIDYSIIRPNGFFSDMSDFLDMAKSGRIYLFGDGTKRLNPISGKDLAVVCVDKMESEKNQESTAGGPDILSHKELGILALKALEKPIKITLFPDWMRRFTIWAARTFMSPIKYGPIEFFLTAMADDNIADCYGKDKLEDFFVEAVKKDS